MLKLIISIVCMRVGCVGLADGSHPGLWKDELRAHGALEAQAKLVRGRGSRGGMVRPPLPHYPGLCATRYHTVLLTSRIAGKYTR